MCITLNTKGTATNEAPFLLHKILYSVFCKNTTLFSHVFKIQIVQHRICNVFTVVTHSLYIMYDVHI